MTDKGFELGNNVFEKFLLDDVNFNAIVMNFCEKMLQYN